MLGSGLRAGLRIRHGPSKAIAPNRGPHDSMHDHTDRLVRLRRRLRGRSMYVSALPNIRYLTGFTGSAGHLLVAPDETTLFTDGRYRLQAHEQTQGIAVEISHGDSRPALVQRVTALRLRRLAFEANRLDYETYAFLAGSLPKCRFDPLRAVVERLRMRKTPAEIAAIRRSVELNSKAFEDVCQRIRPGWTESVVAAELEFAMRTLGAEGAAFPTIVASGTHGALPHAEPRAHQITEKSLVVVDQGAILDGYCSDMTRMIALGHPDATQKKLFHAVLEAQVAAIDAIRPGVECRTVDNRARRVLRMTTVGGTRLDTKFSHSTGHGVGLEIHEGPRVGPRQRQRLETGMVLTVEPGVYLEGLAGVRIEDVVAVTETGCEVLTKTPRELRVLEGRGR